MARVLGAMEPDWRAAVGVREEPELERALVDRLPPPAAPRPVSVTDLVGPRRAFWREFSPVPMDPERQRRVDLGRSIHRRLGAALAGEGALEVRVRSEGVVGRIDLLSDVPVEVKTSASSVGVEHLHSARPDQIEQLAIYCLLARRNSGRLVTVVVADGAPESVQAVDIDMADTEAVRAEVVARASALRQAWVRGQPHGLPACRWFGRGCEFQEAAVCDCASDNPAPSSAIVAAVRAIVERKDVSARIEARLRGVSDPERPRTVNRFRDLLYPRRAYYERTAVKPSPERPHRSPVGPLDLYGRVSAALEGGPLGEVARLVPRSEELEEEVNGYRGVPFLLRISRGQGRASAGSIVERQPQYA
ncbi:MAG: CRISPR-associated protein Cas4, partial [Thermoplasmata archaeon]